MATTSPPALVGIFNQVKPYFKTVKNGGVSNANSPGYHTSRDDLKRQGRGDNYSIQCPADKDGSGSHAAGLDLTFGSLDELITVTKRLRAACTPNSNGDYDPRIEPLREFIGTLDGRNVCGYNRVSTGSGSRSKVGWHPSGYSDSSHLWHAHLSVLRRYVNDKNRMTGIAEVVAGLPKGKLGWKDPDGSTSTPAATKPAPTPTYLPVYVVDPEKVSSQLAAVDRETGKVARWLDPKHRITKATGTLQVGGKMWLLDENGTRYALDYLVLESEYLARTPTPAKADRAAVQAALQAVPHLDADTITAMMRTFDA